MGIGFGGIGVSMFFLTTIISQLTYTLGGSLFAGANGSMMIEVVPFFHILVNGISDVVAGEGLDLEGEGKEVVIATTMVAFALSSVMTGESSSSSSFGWMVGGRNLDVGFT